MLRGWGDNIYIYTDLRIDTLTHIISACAHTLAWPCVLLCVFGVWWGEHNSSCTYVQQYKPREIEAMMSRTESWPAKGLVHSHFILLLLPENSCQHLMLNPLAELMGCWNRFTLLRLGILVWAEKACLKSQWLCVIIMELHGENCRKLSFEVFFSRLIHCSCYSPYFMHSSMTQHYMFCQIWDCVLL